MNKNSGQQSLILILINRLSKDEGLKKLYIV